MNKQCLLISGHSIIYNNELTEELQQCIHLLKCKDNTQILSILEKQSVSLVIFEISKTNKNELKILKTILDKFRKIPIIQINGNGDNELLVTAFEYGIKDAFKKPFDHELIIERVKGILKQQQ